MEINQICYFHPPNLSKLDFNTSLGLFFKCTQEQLLNISSISLIYSNMIKSNPKPPKIPYPTFYLPHPILNTQLSTNPNFHSIIGLSVSQG